MDTNKILRMVKSEYCAATEKFGAFNSAHEGYAVILEELDEAWGEIKQNQSCAATQEMIQVAAMAIRWINDCGDFGDR